MYLTGAVCLWCICLIILLLWLNINIAATFYPVTCGSLKIHMWVGHGFTPNPPLAKSITSLAGEGGGFLIKITLY